MDIHLGKHDRDWDILLNKHMSDQKWYPHLFPTKTMNHRPKKRQKVFTHRKNSQKTDGSQKNIALYKKLGAYTNKKTKKMQYNFKKNITYSKKTEKNLLKTNEILLQKTKNLLNENEYLKNKIDQDWIFNDKQLIDNDKQLIDNDSEYIEKKYTSNDMLILMQLNQFIPYRQISKTVDLVKNLSKNVKIPSIKQMNVVNQCRKGLFLLK